MEVGEKREMLLCKSLLLALKEKQVLYSRIKDLNITSVSRRETNFF